MNEYVASDPMVQRLRTPEEFCQGFSRCENHRSRERRNKFWSLIGRGCMALDPSSKNLGCGTIYELQHKSSIAEEPKPRGENSEGLSVG
jgi:hypothetical protein